MVLIKKWNRHFSPRRNHKVAEFTKDQHNHNLRFRHSFKRISQWVGMAAHLNWNNKFQVSTLLQSNKSCHLSSVLPNNRTILRENSVLLAKICCIQLVQVKCWDLLAQSKDLKRAQRSILMWLNDVLVQLSNNNHNSKIFVKHALLNYLSTITHTNRSKSSRIVKNPNTRCSNCLGRSKPGFPDTGRLWLKMFIKSFYKLRTLCMRVKSWKV